MVGIPFHWMNALRCFPLPLKFSLLWVQRLTRLFLHILTGRLFFLLNLGHAFDASFHDNFGQLFLIL